MNTAFLYYLNQIEILEHIKVSSDLVLAKSQACKPENQNQIFKAI